MDIHSNGACPAGQHQNGGFVLEQIHFILFVLFGGWRVMRRPPFLTKWLSFATITAKKIKTVDGVDFKISWKQRYKNG